MARARNIKPALFKNELLGVADPYVTLLFQSLWCLADKAGRLEDRPLRIKAETFPYRENLDINGYLTVLSRLGFIHRYVVAGVAYIQVVNFAKHQTPHKTEKESVIPGAEQADEEKEPVKQELAEITVKQPLSNGENTAALPPDLLIPDSLIPDLLIQKHATTPASGSGTPAESLPARKSAPKRQASEKAQTVTGQTFDAYSEAYQRRYGVPATSNAKVMGQLALFVGRVPADVAPAVAAHYVDSHEDAFVMRQGHPVDLLLKGAENLHREWQTKRVAGVHTDGLNKQGRATAANAKQWLAKMAELKAAGMDPNPPPMRDITEDDF